MLMSLDQTMMYVVYDLHVEPSSKMQEHLSKLTRCPVYSVHVSGFGSYLLADISAVQDDLLGA